MRASDGRGCQVSPATSSVVCSSDCAQLISWRRRRTEHPHRGPLKRQSTSTLTPRVIAALDCRETFFVWSGQRIQAHRWARCDSRTAGAPARGRTSLSEPSRGGATRTLSAKLHNPGIRAANSATLWSLMPGRRHKGFRQGDLAEDLGVALLKSIAAVASGPRPEDFGLDAVATLLRSEGNLLYAEDSFCVQFKRASIREITYSGHEAAWLRELRLPFFVASVDRSATNLSLYSSHRLTQLLASESPESICLKLEAPPNDEKLTATSIQIGPPVLQWSMSDAHSSAFSELAYSVLKPLIQTEQRNLLYRHAHFVEGLTWTTNQIPSSGAVIFHTFSHTRDRAVSVMKSMSPQVIVLAFDCLFRGNRSELDTLLELVALMRINGHDPDPGGRVQ